MVTLNSIGSRMAAFDPIGYAAGDTNLYRFVANSPVNLTDPSGLAPIRIDVSSDDKFSRYLNLILKRKITEDDITDGNKGCIGMCHLSLGVRTAPNSLPGTRCFKFDTPPSPQQILDLRKKLGAEMPCGNSQEVRTFMIQYWKDIPSDSAIYENSLLAPTPYAPGIKEVDRRLPDLAPTFPPGDERVRFDFLTLIPGYNDTANVWLHMNHGREGAYKSSSQIKFSTFQEGIDQGTGGYFKEGKKMVCFRIGPRATWVTDTPWVPSGPIGGGNNPYGGGP